MRVYQEKQVVIVLDSEEARHLRTYLQETVCDDEPDAETLSAELLDQLEDLVELEG